MINNPIVKRSKWLQRLATGILAVLVLMLVLESVMASLASQPAQEWQFLLSFRVPMPFYLAAIWTIQRAFGRIASGASFDRILPALLSRVGMSLSGGAIASVFISPWLLRALSGSMRGGYAAFDPPAITIGLVGLLLYVLSGLFSKAVEMRHELDEIL